MNPNQDDEEELRTILFWMAIGAPLIAITTITIVAILKHLQH